MGQFDFLHQINDRNIPSSCKFNQVFHCVLKGRVNKAQKNVDINYIFQVEASNLDCKVV
jgi:hypothetical protein